MAHAVSLGRIVAASGVCAPWPERTFRFTVTQAGVLAIVMADRAVRDRVPPTSHHVRHSEIAAAARGDAADRGEDGGHLDPATGCARIHTALAALSCWRQPAAVPFTNGLYFFYEQGEWSPHTPGGRVVRIGNHPRAQDRLVGRLEDHFNSRPGAKNFSVFRRYLGGALLRRQDANGPCLQPARPARATGRSRTAGHAPGARASSARSASCFPRRSRSGACVWTTAPNATTSRNGSSRRWPPVRSAAPPIAGSAATHTRILYEAAGCGTSSTSVSSLRRIGSCADSRS